MSKDSLGQMEMLLFFPRYRRRTVPLPPPFQPSPILPHPLPPFVLSVFHDFIAGRDAMREKLRPGCAGEISFRPVVISEISRTIAPRGTPQLAFQLLEFHFAAGGVRGIRISGILCGNSFPFQARDLRHDSRVFHPRLIDSQNKLRARGAPLCRNPVGGDFYKFPGIFCATA